MFIEQLQCSNIRAHPCQQWAVEAISRHQVETGLICNDDDKYEVLVYI